MLNRTTVLRRQSPSNGARLFGGHLRGEGTEAERCGMGILHQVGTHCFLPFPLLFPINPTTIWTTDFITMVTSIMSVLENKDLKEQVSILCASSIVSQPRPRFLHRCSQSELNILCMGSAMGDTQQLPVFQPTTY